MVCPMPMKISALTSGRMVICKARSHSCPSGATSAGRSASGATTPLVAPSASPAANPAKVQPAGTRITGNTPARVSSAMHCPRLEPKPEGDIRDAGRHSNTRQFAMQTGRRWDANTLAPTASGAAPTPG
jgi:hypothetical protein